MQHTERLGKAAMPAVLTVITEDDLLDFANSEADTEKQMTVRAAMNTDDRVRRLLNGIERVNRRLGDLARCTEAPRRGPRDACHKSQRSNRLEKRRRVR